MRTSGVLENVLNREDDALELVALGRELLASGGGERVVPRPAIVLRDAPLGFDVAVEEEALQRGIERALTDSQHVVRELAHSTADAVAMHRATNEGAKNEQVECARQELRCAASHGLSHRLSMGLECHRPIVLSIPHR